MKNNIVILFVLIILSFSYGAAVGRYEIFPFSNIQSLKKIIVLDNDQKSITIKDDEKNYRWLDRVSLFEKLNKTHDIVVFGDSIMERFEWTEYFKDVDIVNRGIAGDTSFLILERLDNVVATKPEKVFLMIGINDLNRGRSPETIFNNIVSIAEKLNDNGIKVIMQSVILLSEEYDLDHKVADNKEILKLNELIKEYCFEKKYIYVDHNENLAYKGYLNNDYTIDGFHLNGNGYFILAENLKKYIYQ